MTSEGISKAEKPTATTEQMPDDNHVPSVKTAGAAGWAPEKRAAVEKKMKRKLDARCSLFVLIYIMNYLGKSRHSAGIDRCSRNQLTSFRQEQHCSCKAPRLRG